MSTARSSMRHGAARRACAVPTSLAMASPAFHARVARRPKWAPPSSDTASTASGAGYIVSMTVRIAGTAASFDAARQQQFLSVMQKASPSALKVSITSVTEVSVGRRRLLAAYLDIGLDMLYADQASAESAAASDLAESSLNGRMVDAGLGTLTVTAQPTVRQAAAAAGSDTATTTLPRDAAIPTWVIIVASVGGTLAVGVGVAIIIWRRMRGERRPGTKVRPETEHVWPKMMEPASPRMMEPARMIESNTPKEHLLQQEHRLPIIPQIAYGDIVMGHEIGNGAFKKVFKATWSREGKEAINVAILVLRQGDCDISQEIKVFEILGRHPNLTRLMATTRNAEGSTCLVSEFAPWGSLDNTVGEFVGKGTRLEDTVLLTVAMQVCEGMRALRLHGIVHRDLAARNILVFGFHPSICRSVKVKISDYGLAIKGTYGAGYVQWGTSSSIGGGKGPVRWSSPEAIQKGLFGEKSDMFSFGVLLWELWSECNIPFYLINDDAEVARRVCEEREVLSKPANCPDSVFALMQQTWRYAARQRPSFDEVRQELDTCMHMILTQAAQSAAALDNENECVVCMEQDAVSTLPHSHDVRFQQCALHAVAG